MVSNNLFKIKTKLEKYIGIWRNSIKTWVTLTLKKKILKQDHQLLNHPISIRAQYLYSSLK